MAPPLRPRPSRTRVKMNTTAFTGKITDNGPRGTAKVVYYFSTFRKKSGDAMRTGGDAVRPCCNTCGKTTDVVLSYHTRGFFVPRTWFSCGNADRPDGDADGPGCRRPGYDERRACAVRSRPGGDGVRSGADDCGEQPVRAADGRVPRRAGKRKTPRHLVFP